MVATATALALAALPLAASAETVLGIYIFHRHGDRTAKSTPPTYLTALGADQVLTSGAYYRGRYVSDNATQRIAAVSPDVAVLSQLSITAPIDNVLQNSASVFAQGLYPPAGDVAKQTLANGSVTEMPLGGYQYIPVNGLATAASSGASEDSEWLQGGSGCGNAVVSSNNFFTSKQYLDTLASTADFYKSVLPVVNQTFTESQASFKNGYTIWDLINVARIHNSTIQSAGLITDDVFHQLATRADQHEWGLAYNASEPVRAIAGSVLAAQVIQSLNTTLQAPVSKASTTRMGIQFGAYGTFMAFFGLAQLPAVSADFTGVCGYASSMVFELVTNATVPAGQAAKADDVSVRFLFSNGSASADHEPVAYPLFGQKETLLPWKTFTDEMNNFAVGDTLDWCKACGNSTGVCAAAAGSGGSGSGSGSASSTNNSTGSGISRPVAGVIGALVTLAVILGIEALVMLVGGLRLVKKSVAARGKAAEAGHA